MNTERDFWKKLKIGGADECWEFQRGRMRQGYGIHCHGGRRISAHRMAYTLTYGEIPEGMDVLHRCDNPPCCNPAHLFLGTHTDNMADKTRKGRCNACRGVRAPNAKLTDKAVQEIRAAYKPGRFWGGRLFAAKYGVAPSKITAVAKGQAWKHVLPIESEVAQ